MGARGGQFGLLWRPDLPLTKMMDAGWSDDVIVDQIASARKMNGGVVWYFSGPSM